MKTTNKTHTIVLAVVVLFSALLVVLFNFNNRERKLIKEAETVIDKIEQYKALNSCYPNTLAEVGCDYNESGPLFYQKNNNTSYMLYFGTTLGESKIYYPETKTWK